MSLSLTKMGRHLPTDTFGLNERHNKKHNIRKDIPMKTERKTVEYWSESQESWVDLHQMHHDHLINLIIKLVTKDYDGKFQVITECTETIKQEDEYVVTSFIQ